MNITHYIGSLDPALGGVVAHATDLALLTARAGAAITIVTPFPDPRPEAVHDEPGVRVVGIGRPALGGVLLSRRQLGTFMGEAERADVIHLHETWIPANLQIASRARRSGRPYVATPHGMLDDWCMARHSFRKRAYLALFGTRYFAGAERVLLCARGELDQSARWIGGTPGRVVPAAMDLEPYAELPGPDLARGRVTGADGDEPVVLFLSRIHPKKGLETLIDAVAMLAERGRTPRLIVAGTGSDAYVEQLRARADRAGLSARTHFVGLVRGREKVSLYQRASVMALPTHQENFGLVLTESMAAGTPVVTTRGVDIWPEIESSGGGLIAERTPDAFADAIDTLLGDPTRAAGMGASARVWVMREMNPETLAAKFMAVYAEAAAAPAD